MSTPGPQVAAPAESSPVQKMTLPTLTAMVIGGMVGAGVFSLPARFALTQSEGWLAVARWLTR